MVIANTLALCLNATPDSVRRARREVAEVAESAGMSAGAIDDVRLCVNEAVANAVVHAYREEPGAVDLVVDVDDAHMRVVVRDHGVGLTSQMSARNGYGLRLMEALAEGFAIGAAPGGGTEVRMAFRLSARPSP